ncbi:hypothetical protein ACP6NG_09145 [Brevibacterium casei]|uniref:Uncharacterized protein n=1 Tax=Brevibacterium casei TaxID=33889 RepID=A0A449D812_9MICO|nr:hypothetical protein [Brevibacterium casei]VEW13578.1 Uncharacterised protein [Brevibacterium casei]
MNVENLITGALTVFFGGGLVGVLNAWWGRNRSKAQSETEARAQRTDEFRAWQEAQNEKIRQLNEEMAEVKSEVKEVRAEARSAEDYIDVLIIGISDGTIPPIPARLPRNPSQ